ncbi:PREDICTED: kinesin-like protein KIN-4C [Tarenaya hassleriana]|uniref:kinesin-like protein KIN-4C n=1 Tax=Tarenaya hassleriana TaxID=28532 RepID=UPI00053C2697|nr:PREDICTED: kinesin-like protein KIN-4C [Tarenaya hassleriana]
MRKLNRRSKDSSNPAVAGAGAPDVTQQQSEKRIRDLELENGALKREIEELRSKQGDISSGSSVTQHSREDYHHRSSAAKEQAMSSRSKPHTHSQCPTKNTPSSSATKQIDDEVHKLKAQKVKLQCKIKLDSMHFRLCKASLEKEILQLRKAERKINFEKHALIALNRRQKMIMKLKHTQAITAVKQLKLLLESRKIPTHKNNGPPKGTNVGIQDSNSELQLMTRLNAVHSAYERQMKEMREEIKLFGLEADTVKAELLKDQNPLSCENQAAHPLIDSELKELKEEFNRLSSMVSQMEMTKSQLSEPNKSQGNSVGSSVSTGKTNYQTSTESSPSENSLPSPPQEPSEEKHCTTEESKANVCCSCTKKSLCKTLKCQCMANGSGCGESCRCIASRCTNREAMPSSANAAQKIIRDKQPLHEVGNTLDVKACVGKVGKLKKERKRASS